MSRAVIAFYRGIEGILQPVKGQLGKNQPCMYISVPKQLGNFKSLEELAYPRLNVRLFAVIDRRE